MPLDSDISLQKGRDSDVQKTLAKRMGFRAGEQAAGRLGPWEQLTLARQGQWTHPVHMAFVAWPGPTRTFSYTVSTEALPDSAGPVPCFQASSTNR